MREAYSIEWCFISFQLLEYSIHCPTDVGSLNQLSKTRNTITFIHHFYAIHPSFKFKVISISVAVICDINMMMMIINVMMMILIGASALAVVNLSRDES